MRDREQRSGEAGFTLIELMIVMIVLATLAGIVLMALESVSDDASESACVAEVRSLRGANAQYQVRHGTDAPDADALVDAGYLAGPPSYVGFADGVTDPATMADCS